MIINKNDAILVILCFKMLDGGTAVQLWLLKDFGWRLGLCVFVFVIVFVFVFVFCVFVCLCLKMLDGGTVVHLWVAVRGWWTETGS